MPLSTSSFALAPSAFAVALAFTLTEVGAAADFNGDQGVTSADLSVWAAKFGMTGAGWDDGDADLDDDVDGTDFLLWQRMLGAGSAATASAAEVATDSAPGVGPTTFDLAMLAGLPNELASLERTGSAYLYLVEQSPAFLELNNESVRDDVFAAINDATLLQSDFAEALLDADAIMVRSLHSSQSPLADVWLELGDREGWDTID